ncbi:MAG: IMP cyclohydrolase [Clostridia bacterium]|nr:IMP cyclohydrolase [Clostridia bacterium]
MDTYKIMKIEDIIKATPYLGRGIVTGTSADGKYAVIGYFISGRSENSRNRIFVENGSEVIIHPFDASKVEDPSLIIYSPIRVYENNLIVTNGDQTDTVYEGLEKGLSFKESLESRCFEPDEPNFTPRISSMLTFNDGSFKYEVSILKSIDEKGSDCARYTFSYPSVNGLGHFIHTYACDGNPLPTFTGEPERVEIGNDIDEFTNNIWNSLDQQNKISLYTRFIDKETGKETNRMINKHLK